MGLFSTSSPLDSDVEKATDGVTEDWSKILDVCEKARSSSQSAKDCLTAIITRLKNKDPHIAIHAVTLLDACVKNCGKVFHLIIASRDFEKEFRGLLQSSQGEVRSKLLSALASWAETEFKTDPQLNLIPSLCNSLKRDGITFPTGDPQKSEKSGLSSKEKDDTYSKEEVDNLVKAIELSLKETSLPKGKTQANSGSASLYPTMSLSSSASSPEEKGRRVRALYDFEAAEENELTFKAGEIINVLDDSDPNWWKGSNKRGDGLFPSSFVTTDLSLESDQPRSENKKTVQFDEAVQVKNITKEEVEIDEEKMDRLLHYLHEADPRDPSGDPPEMRQLEEEVNAMGPLIDAELERVDTKHAQLSQLCMDLVDAINLYHTLMKEPSLPGPSYLPKPMGYNYPPLQMNGVGPSSMIPNSPYPMMPGNMPLPVSHPGPIPPHLLPNAHGRPLNGVPQYGPPPNIMPGMHPGYQQSGPGPQSLPAVHNPQQVPAGMPTTQPGSGHPAYHDAHQPLL